MEGTTPIRRGALLFATCILCIHTVASAEEAADVSTLAERVEALARQNRALAETVEALQDEVRAARDEARAAEALAASRGPLPAVSQAADETVLSAPLGRARVRLLDLSLNLITTAGFSSATDDELELLQGGNHDPRQRGFSLPQLELSFQGAVDPFFTGEAHLLYFLDGEGESRFELEEAFVQTLMLPFGLERQGLQLELGHFLTEFGRHNPRHAHAWSWLDQPVILTRLFGEDGIRGPGARLGWLLPLPWTSELHVGAQTAKGETMLSFLANDEVFEERPLGGRPFDEGARTGSPNDLVKLVRWANGFDLSDTWSAQIGASFLHGPNATGPEGYTLIYGADLVAKWRPLSTDAGWPFLVFEAELLKRHYFADEFSGCPEEEACADPAFFPKDTLEDWGGYAQVLWGFRRDWAAGLRYEYASGSGTSLGDHASRNDDPFRDDRHRVSPLLLFQPTEFSRIRLQYSYDRADHLGARDAHSVWAGFDFVFGAHGAHAY